MSFLGKVTDLVILNILTLICCIPILTIGAALSAAHYAAIKMYRDTDDYVVKNFFRSFKTNLRQGTGIWLMFLVVMGMSVFAFSVYGNEGINGILKAVVLATMIFIIMTMCWVIPLQARFSNKVFMTIRNGFMLACRYIFRTLGMLVIFVLTVLVWSVGFQWFWLPLMIGISLPVYGCVFLYNKVFLQLEEKILEAEKEAAGETENEEEENPFCWEPVEDAEHSLETRE